MGLFQSLWNPHFEKEKFGHRQANGKNTDVSKPRRGAWFRFSFEAVRRKQPRWHLDCGLLASRIMINKFLLFKPSNLCYGVMSDLADQSSHKVWPKRIETRQIPVLLLREEVSASLHTPHSSVGRAHCVRPSTVIEPHFLYFFVDKQQ